MEENQSTSVKVKDAVHRLQLSLLDGIQNEDQLFAAGSLMSRGDYQDVVVERSIAKLCGYPLCKNSLPSEQARKGRYRISLKEHKVYDQQEIYMYCSSNCLVNSRAFGGSLQEERSMVQNPAKLADILRLFDKLSLDSEGMGKNGDLGMANLMIQERSETKVGEVSLEDWVGPSNAIEGYVPQRDRNSKSSSPAKGKGHRDDEVKSSSEQYSFVNDLDFTSTIIMSDEYSISKTPSSLATSSAAVKDIEGKGSSGKFKAQSSGSTKLNSGKISRISNTGKAKAVKIDGMGNQDVASPSNPQSTSSLINAGAKETSEVGIRSEFCQSRLKPSLKSPGSKKLGRSVTWADEEVGSSKSNGLHGDEEMKDNFTGTLISSDGALEGDDCNSLLLESAEACAMALSQAAEAAASGEVDTADAISEAGLIILPQADTTDHNKLMEVDNMEGQESVDTKWPSKPGIPRTGMFDPEDSWYDGPPEGFSLELSPFATMWMALFGWVTSSSLAYIYGKDESSHEDYLTVNGREYPHKIVLGDGRSSEIRRTVEGCLARALPAVVTDLRLPVPNSTLEQGVGRLLNTMGFADAIPALRMKQWHVLAILFLEALSVCRIPALTSHISNMRGVIHQVLEGARIGTEEYAVMKDLMMPLGRLPGFASQSGA